MTFEPTWLPEGDITLDRTFITGCSLDKMLVLRDCGTDTGGDDQPLFSGQTVPMAGAETATGGRWCAACIDKPFG